MSEESVPQTPDFASLGLSSPLLKALKEVGYETPSAIQAMTIPPLLEGRDVLGQAQTGTGKTAAFALPLLQSLDLKLPHTQGLVLAPTRELAIQVAEAFNTYARHLKGFHVLPVYGGQDYSGQIRGLKRGAHVVVGTPGRIMDHMRKGTLVLDHLSTLVLDEADEMLRMGFIDDVEWILEQMPEKHQTALFSATMPQQIHRIATRYLNDAEEITIKVKTTTAETIRQRYWPVKGVHKLDALTRILEAEEFDGMIIFVRTKTTTVELAEKLSARGYACSALNGDISQQLRERTVDKLKKGNIDIIVATDVAARGLDVERISHVVNYDVPHDTEGYVHRIGRTGRAGRKGDAILFVAPRERRMLQAIERATRQPIELMELPSAELIANTRIARFKEKLVAVKEENDLSLSHQLISQIQSEFDWDAEEIAAALAFMAQGENSFLQVKQEREEQAYREPRESRGNARPSREDRPRPSRDREPARLSPREEGMDRFRIEVGHNHSVKPGNIVGAIANEAGIDSKYIGRIAIFDDYSVIDLPAGMPKETSELLQGTWVAGRQLRISVFNNGDQEKTAGEKPGKKFSGDKEFKGKKFKSKDGNDKDFRGKSFKVKPKAKSGSEKPRKFSDKKPGKFRKD